MRTCRRSRHTACKTIQTMCATADLPWLKRACVRCSACDLKHGECMEDVAHLVSTRNRDGRIYSQRSALNLIRTCHVRFFPRENTQTHIVRLVIAIMHARIASSSLSLTTPNRTMDATSYNAFGTDADAVDSGNLYTSKLIR